MKNQNRPNETVINPAGFARDGIRAEPLPHVDHLVMDESGNRLIPPDAKFRDEARAVQVGRAAGHITYAEDLTEEVTPPASTHDGKEAELEAVEPRRGLAEQKHEKMAQMWSALCDVPHNVIDPHRKIIGYVAKGGFIVGDTAVLANQLNRSGSALLLAILVGLSLAVTVVVIGAQCGHEVGAANQRKLRGPVPEGAPVQTRTLYDSGDAEVSYDHWLHLAYATAGTMFLTLFFLGFGSGDSPKLALGYGLLGSLTVAGSACAEAYATNEAAEHLKSADGHMTVSGEALKEFETMESESALTLRTALLRETAARHRALATETAVAAEANRIPDSPDIGGYVDAGHMPDPQPTPLPVEVAVVAVAPAITSTRSRKRHSYSLNTLTPSESADVPQHEAEAPAAADVEGVADFPSEVFEPPHVNGTKDSVGA